MTCELCPQVVAGLDRMVTDSASRLEHTKSIAITIACPMCRATWTLTRNGMKGAEVLDEAALEAAGWRLYTGAITNAENFSVDALCRCGHVNDVHGEDGDCSFPGCGCGLFVIALGALSKPPSGSTV